MKKLLFLCSLLLASLASADTAFQTYYPPSYAFASKPACSAANSGMLIQVSDVGVDLNGNTSGSQWRCDGTNSSWAPVSKVVVCRKTTITTRTGDGAGGVDETSESDASATLASCTIPANLMGDNGVLRYWVLSSNNNSGNAKSFRARWNGVAGTVCNLSQPTTNTSGRWYGEIANRNATNSQICHNHGTFTSFSQGGAAIGTSSVDTTSAVTFLVTCTLVAASSDSCSVEHMVVELE